MTSNEPSDVNEFQDGSSSSSQSDESDDRKRSFDESDDDDDDSDDDDDDDKGSDDEESDINSEDMDELEDLVVKVEEERKKNQALNQAVQKMHHFKQNGVKRTKLIQQEDDKESES